MYIKGTRRARMNCGAKVAIVFEKICTFHQENIKKERISLATTLK